MKCPVLVLAPLFVMMTGFPGAKAAALPEGGLGARSSEPAALCEEFHGLEGGDSGPVLVMVLSPRMVYALKEWPRMRETARQAGFAVISLRDPRVSEEEWQSAVHAAGRPDAASLAVLEDARLLGMRILNHAPTSVVILNHRVHSWPIHGVMPDGPWRTVLAARLAQLKACP